MTYPDNWQYLSIKDCCNVVSGSTPKRNKLEYWDGDIDWVTPKDLSNLNLPVLQEAPEKITELGYKSCSTTLLPKGSILFSSRAPIGLIAIAGKEMCTNQGFKSLVPNKSIDSAYLYWCIRKFTPQLAAQGSGTTFKELSKTIVEKFKIPLPPLEEQKRIAAILDKADAIRRQRKEAIALTEELLRSTFLDMFGDPVTNPKGWEKKSFGDLAPQKGQIVDGPFGSTLKPECYVTEGVRVVRNFNIQDDFFDESEFVFVTEEKFTEIKRSNVLQRDILLSTKGTIGNVCVMPSLKGNSVLSASGTVRIRFPKKLSALPEFIVQQMIQKNYKHYMKWFEAGTNQKYLNLSGIRKMEIIVPPLELQHKFLSLRMKNNSLKSRNNTNYGEIEDLFTSLLQKAFRGEL